MGHEVKPESSQGHTALEPAQRHAALERYLRLATWGLWGRKKLEVRRELEGNIQELALEFQMAGCPREEAILRALEEFGPPEKVSRGMNRVYALPHAIRSLVLAGVLASVTINLIGQSQAQVTFDTRLPIEPCAQSTAATFKVGPEIWPCEMGDPLISMNSLRSALEPQGVTFKSPLGSPEVGATVYATFPDGKEITIRGWGSDAITDRYTFLTRDGQTVEYARNSDRAQGSMVYLSELLRMLAPVNLEGWNNTTVRKGSVSFSFGTQTAPLAGGYVYSSALSLLLDSYLPSKTCDPVLTWHPDNKQLSVARDTMHQNRIQTKLAAGTVVVVLYGLDPKVFPIKSVYQDSCDRSTFAWVAPIAADGKLEITSFPKSLKFVGDFKRPVPSSTLEIADAVLLTFNGKLDFAGRSFQVVPPDQITVEK